MEVQIQKFETHYRLPYRALAEQRRLDRVRTRVLDQTFEQALADELPEEAELCIRSLFVPVRVNLRDSDESIAVQWSAALAAEIAGALRNGANANAVLYHSRRQAVMDLAISVSHGDLSRAWAWRQLGLWRSSETAGETQAISELARTLCETSKLVVPTLHVLAQAGRLHHIAGRFTETEWQDLAEAALSAVGLVHLLKRASGIPSARALRDARRVLKNSLLVRAVTSSGFLVNAGEPTLRAVAALAVMDADPSLLFTETARGLISVTANAISTARNETIDCSTLPQARDGGGFTETLGMDRTPSALADGGPGGIALAFGSGEGEGEGEPAKNQTATGIPDPAGPRQRSEVGYEDPVVKPDDAATVPLDLRRRAFTGFGGLLFLLAVIEDLKFPEEIMANAAFEARPFVWVVHQLGLALAPIESLDPAALAFAGLPPDAKPPSDDEDATSETEARELKALATRVGERLCALLDCEDQAAGAVLDSVCRRRAEIVADPGWIEVKLSLDEVTTDIRRAGLDLNPGYVPWLGVVVVFVYE